MKDKQQGQTITQSGEVELTEEELDEAAGGYLKLGDIEKLKGEDVKNANDTTRKNIKGPISSGDLGSGR